ncbi:MAG TPA: S-layer homology domain-containing protein, partial [Clostridia bacterium]|nr:S-layer homology domain-containing protein [Clostridia bacterium]
AAEITFDAKVLSAISEQAAGEVKITVAKADASSLSEADRQKIGDRPVFDFRVTGGDKTISQFGGTVTVSVPYTPKEGEDINAIVIYYINSKGEAEAVPGCRYDAATGRVIFETDHFSTYAVGYNKISFKDVDQASPYAEAVTFIAARGITGGTGNGNFSPGGTLTRGEFMVMLMRAYNISPDTSPADNFADAGSTWYTGYLSAAKRLGISNGVGGNLFAPERKITKQELYTLLYNSLKAIDKLPEGDSGKNTSVFSDKADIASWAKDAVSLFVKAGIIETGEGKLSPAGKATRAEMATIMYNLLSK